MKRTIALSSTEQSNWPHVRYSKAEARALLRRGQGMHQIKAACRKQAIEVITAAGGDTRKLQVDETPQHFIFKAPML